MKSNTIQNATDQSTPRRATCGSRAAYARCQKPGSTSVESAMKYQTRIAEAGLPPFHVKWEAGSERLRNDRPPCCATRKHRIRAMPAYMSTNCT